MFVKAKPIKLVYEDESLLIKKLTEVFEYVANYFDFDLTIEDKMDEIRTINYTDIAHILHVTFSRGKDKVRYEAIIPRYSNGIIQISGVRRFFQKQIKDNLYIAVSDLKLMMGDLFFTIKDRQYIDYNKVRLPLYMVYEYFREKYEIAENEWEECCINEQLDPNIYEQYKVLKSTKKPTYKVLTEITAESKVKRLLWTLELGYEIYKDFLQSYSKHLPDLLFKSYLMYGRKIDQDYGLNLVHRRVRSQTTIIFDAYVDYFLRTLISNLTSRKKKTSFRMDPTSVMYDFIIMEQFHAPLATLADMNRCIITGRGGYQDESIPISKRDIHPTHYMNLDPCVTPDRDRAGIVLYLATGAELDEFGRFKNLIKDEQKLLNQIYTEAKNEFITPEMLGGK